MGPDYLGTLAANDECDRELDRWRSYIRDGLVIHYPVPVECRDENGELLDCPEVYGTENACLEMEVGESQVGTTLHVFAMSSGNEQRGSGDLIIWKKIEHLRYNEYRRVRQASNVSFGGTHIAFSDGWQDDYEVDVIIPSPERAGEIGNFLLPGATPASIFLMEPLPSIYKKGNGMAGGARLTDLGYNPWGKVVVATNRHVAAGPLDRNWAVDVYLNDVGHEDRDGDGLGLELEVALGTDADNRDTDGDGIWDGFEVLGIRTGSTGYPEQALPTWGANPLHKDVFVETDYMCDETMPRCAEPIPPSQAVYAAGVAARHSGGLGYLDNPDGRPGFSLHFDNGIENAEDTVYGNWGGVNPTASCGNNCGAGCGAWESAGYYLDNHMNPVRRGVFTYSVATPHGRGGGINPAVCFRETLPENDTGRNFLHELGHHFGLGHAGCGAGSYNHKPNYISVMNYSYTDIDDIGYSEGERLYAMNSAGQLVPYLLDPAAMDESLNVPVTLRNHLDARTLWEGRGWWYRTWGQGTDWMQVDWDRSGTEEPDTMTSARLLGYWNSTPAHRVVDNKYVKYGPQLSQHEDNLLIFYSLLGENLIRFFMWHEEDCDPENIEMECGSFTEEGVVDVPVNIGSQMSVLNITGDKWENLFVLYKNTSNSLCLVKKKILPLPGYNLWDGPYCKALDWRDAPEAIFYQGKIQVFGLKYSNTQNTTVVAKEEIDPDTWTDTSTWQEIPVRDGEDNEITSAFTPAVAVDPGEDGIINTNDDTLIMIKAGYEYVMELLLAQVSQINLFSMQEEERWLLHPKDTNAHQYFTAHRPSMTVEILHSGIRRWHLWYYRPDFFMTSPEYYSLTSSHEDPTGTGEKRNVFSVNNAIFLVPLSPEVPPRADNPNVSLAFYRGKLRGAVNYDNNYREAPGFVLHTVADGIFHTELGDCNDLAIIRENMSRSLDFNGVPVLFAGMPDAVRQVIEELNHVSGTGQLRQDAIEIPAELYLDPAAFMEFGQ